MHERAIGTATRLTRYFQEAHRPRSVMVSPKKVVRVLHEAKVSFVLMGTHGLNSWRSKPRATQDVDVLVARKDHVRAVRTINAAFPKLVMSDYAVVTRFKDPVDDEPRIDLMKPSQKVFKMAFRHTLQVDKFHRIPDLEMALISKFAAMVSPRRERLRKMQDAVDFADMFIRNQTDVDRIKLARLAEQVYKGGRKEISKLIDDILAGGKIEI
jgi:hypothetical protein